MASAGKCTNGSATLLQRTARVKLDEQLSNLVKIKEGVPQGGVISSTLFLVYINDLVEALPSTLDSRLSWKAQIETTEKRSYKKLSLMKKLAGTIWGANGKILGQVYTGAIRQSWNMHLLRGSPPPRPTKTN